MSIDCPLENVRWLTAGANAVSPVIVRTFQANSPSNAKLAITGLGFFVVYINGNRISDDRFVPCQSDYEPRDTSAFLYPINDQFTYRIYYLEYDVSDFLTDGENKIEIHLGDGWYRQKERAAEGIVDYSDCLKTAYSISFTENGNTQKTVCSDGSEVWRKSQIIYQNLFIGEVHDLRENQTETFPVSIVKAPKATLSLQRTEPDRVVRKIKPAFLREQNGRKIFDVGENISGHVAVTSKGSKNNKILLRFAENLNENGLDFLSTGANYSCVTYPNQIMQDTFIEDGSTHVFRPEFTWHTFRYFDISGEFDSVLVEVVYSVNKVKTTFESDHEGLNFLYDAYIRTQKNSMHSGVPFDCPHRERLGYTGDGQITAPAAMLTLDTDTFYRKWIRDILDGQDATSGHVQHTAPFLGGGGGPGGWGSAVVLVPYCHYRNFADLSVLEECFVPMQKWLDYMLAHSENGLVTTEEKGGWCLGDWSSIDRMELPEPFVNTCYLIRCFDVFREVSKILKRFDCAKKYDLQEKRARQAIVDNYFEKETGNFCHHKQGANAFALQIGLGHEKTLRNLNEYYQKLGILDTGFLGTDILLDVLFSNGCGDTALRLLNSREPGSFLYMKDNGATTLWEHMRGITSHCQPMFGACARQLFESVLGIRQNKDSYGWKKVTISPIISDKIRNFKGSLETVNGIVSVDVSRQNSNVMISVEVPDNMEAVLMVHGVKYEIRNKFFLCVPFAENNAFSNG